MKTYFNHLTVTVLLSLLIQLNSKSQVTFTIAPTACAGSTHTLSLMSGSVSVLSNTWAALPVGPIFSNANSTLSSVNFPGAGIFTIAVAAITSNGLAYFTNTISVLALPSLTLSQNTTTTCITSNFPKYSKPVQLSAIGASSYTWYPLQPPPIIPGNPGQTDVRPSVSTCYTVVGNTSGCESSASICVTVIPQFSMQVTPDPAVRCFPDSLKLSIINIESTAVGPISAWTYSWTEASTSTLITLSSYFTPSVIVFPSTASSYTAEVRDSRDCVSLPKIVAVSVQTCTSIKTETDEQMEVIFFPNPILDELNWKIKTRHLPLEQVTIINALGQIVYKDIHPGFQNKIDLSSLSNGIYFLCFKSAEKEKSIKFIKN